MADFQVFGVIDNDWKLEEKDTLIIAGLYKHFKSFDFANNKSLQAGIGHIIDANKWDQAVARLSKTGKVPLHFDNILLVSLNDKVSRGNSPSNSIALWKELKTIKPTKLEQDRTKHLRVILLTEYAHCISNVAAVARSSSVYSRKTKNDLQWEHIRVHLHVVNGDKKITHKDIEFLTKLGKSIKETAFLVDSPANELTTNELVKRAKGIADELKCKIKVIEGEDLLKQGFGGIYHVGKAAQTPPAFVTLSHEPHGATKTIALVGKGVCYDTGGFSLKPSDKMPVMKIDMAGAAALMHSFSILVSCGFKQNLHCCMCIVENSVSPVANKPDDIIKLLSGKTVEINNTDCEGRLILADGVFYAKDTLKADTILDMATLTYGMKFIGGIHHAAIMSNLEDVEQKVVKAGKLSGDLTTPMLFAPELHMADLKSEVADMKNSGMFVNNSPNSCVAACFIGDQIDYGEGLTWIHIDMLCPAFIADRATGYGPALIATLLGEHTDIDVLHQH